MYPITSRFNEFEYFRKSPHKGIDFAMENGTPLKAITEGQIKIIDYGNLLSGKTVVIKGEDGLSYIYGHLSNFAVKNGDYVKLGDLIGFSGNSGSVFGSKGGYHLHFAIKNEQGQFIEPAQNMIEFIQNMNNPQYISSLISNSENVVSSEIEIKEIIEQLSEGLSNLSSSFVEIKMNIISIIHFFI